MRKEAVKRIGKMSVEDFRAEAKRLLVAARLSEIELYEWLILGEAHPHLWEDTGRRYTECLELWGFADPGKYEAYKRARRRLDLELIKEIGIAAAIAAARFPTEEEQQEVVAEARAYVESNGAPPSSRSVQRFTRDLRTRHAAQETHKPYARLHEEGKTLRARVTELETQNTLLREENKTLRKENRELRAQTRKKGQAA